MPRTLRRTVPNSLAHRHESTSAPIDGLALRLRNGLRAVRSSLGRADTVRMLWRRQVKSLSLTGKILYHLRITDHFLVQWAQLSTLFPRAAFRQLLC